MLTSFYRGSLGRERVFLGGSGPVSETSLCFRLADYFLISGPRPWEAAARGKGAGWQFWIWAKTENFIRENPSPMLGCSPYGHPEKDSIFTSIAGSRH